MFIVQVYFFVSFLNGNMDFYFFQVLKEFGFFFLGYDIEGIFFFN